MKILEITIFPTSSNTLYSIANCFFAISSHDFPGKISVILMNSGAVFAPSPGGQMDLFPFTTTRVTSTV